MRGRIRFFDIKKGYGFIVPDEPGTPDVFVHASDCEKSGIGRPEKDQIIRFEIVEGPRGPKAVNLQRDPTAPRAKTECN